MRLGKVILIALILVLITALGGCTKITDVFSKATPLTWKVVSVLDTGFSNNNALFLDKNTGITVGTTGEIHFTKDGGKNWGRGNNSSLCLFGISMINDKVAFACGNGSTVIKTANGGDSWDFVSGFGEYEPNHPRYISFIDENTGWIAATSEFLSTDSIPTKLGYTKDGGNTWNTVQLPKDLKDIIAIYLRTQNDGYVLDSDENLYITKDGGKSFTKQHIDIKGLDRFATYSPQIALKFFDSKNALICYTDLDKKLQAARSSDGGKTWVKDKMPDIEAGCPNLSIDGNTLTVTYPDGSIKIFSCK